MVVEYFLTHKELDINKEMTTGFKVEFNRADYLLKYTIIIMMVEMKKTLHFLYQTGLRQVAERNSLEAQLQYNFDVPKFLNTNFTIGTDYRNSKSMTAGTLYGINEDRDDYIITGAYLQGTSKISDKLDLTYAGRYDKFNFIDEGAFAPRVAIVYKANENHTFRASFQ